MSQDNRTWGLAYGEPLYDEDSETEYTPFIGNNGQVGYRCDSHGYQTFLYLNASRGSDDGVATVFVYQDEDPDLLEGALVHFDIWAKDEQDEIVYDEPEDDPDRDEDTFDSSQLQEGDA